ncbi:hypothetical protein [Rickettsia endosymbiont of Orchestes rusci]|uniref:hypothetical protein n=1 Tax=Rickettsia endosymbiont of Orchestes rusci TaxID=3066250 RepID=UPI00313B66FF
MARNPYKKTPSLRSHEVAAAIRTITNYIRDLIRILNKFILDCRVGINASSQ